MCGGHSTSNTLLQGDQCTVSQSCQQIVPNPAETLVSQNLPDGYWLEAFYFQTTDCYPDLIGYGLGKMDQRATITLFVNPKNNAASNISYWMPIPLKDMDFPVAFSFADLTGNGYNDIVICDRYGPTMNELWDADKDDGGRVQWLKNPGNRFVKKYWDASHIGNSTGMHRLKVGHFTTSSVFQVLAIPIIPRSGDLTSPAPVIVFTPEYSASDSSPASWKEDIPFTKEFRLIHDIKLVPASLRDDGVPLDTALVAGREGVVYLHYDVAEGKWEYTVVGTGLPQEGDNPYWGSGSVDIGAVHDDPVGYIATCEGFHGNIVSVYIKKAGAPPGAASLLKSSFWERVKIDDFGPLQSDVHTGTIHHVATGDFDGAGVDAFAIACMGVPIGKIENEGVYVYRPTDLDLGKFHKSKVTSRSAGRLAIARFTTSKLDIGSISYYVPGYHTGPDCPSIRINPNAFISTLSSTDIRAHRLQDEVLILVPRPKAAVSNAVTEMPLIEVAGKRLHVYVVRPNATVQFDPRDGVKVMYGEIVMKDQDGKEVRRGLAPPRYKVSTTRILSTSGTLTAGPSGAVVMRLAYVSSASQGPFHTMNELPISNVFPASTPADVCGLNFEFVKVDKLAWADSGKWDGFEFYNMTGFHVHFGDNTLEKLCHIRLWTLGLGETARFHVHDKQPFCEIHCCIANGGGQAGMRWFPDSVSSVDKKAELIKSYVDSNTKQVIVPALHEHGPLWKVQLGFDVKPKLLSNGCVDYPWHAWLASQFGDWKIPIKPPLSPEEQSYDVWLAFEFPILAFQPEY